MQVGLAEAQLRVQACVACGAVGTTQLHLESAERWWIGIRGERHGPYTIDQLAGFASDGRISPNSYVWGPNFQAWARAAQVPQLAAACAARAAPPPLPPPLPPATRSPARPVTRAGMFAGPRPSNEVSVSQAMPLPVQDSVIAPLVSLSSPKSTSLSQAAATTIRLDDVRRPPPTVFGMQAVASSPPAASPPLVASPAPATPSSTQAAAVLAPQAEHETGPPGVSQIAETLLAPVDSVTAPTPPAPQAKAPHALSTAPATQAAPSPVIKPAAAAVAQRSAPSASHTLSRVPEPASAVGDAGLDDDFFGAAEPKPSADIFAAMDGSGSQASTGSLDLSSMMADSLSGGRVRHPTKAEMHALRQEFSVVARLEKHNRKRWIMVAAGALFILGVVLAAVAFAPSRELEFGDHGTSVGEGTEAARPLYEVPVAETPVVEAVAVVETAEDPKAVAANVTKTPRDSNSGATRVVAKTNGSATNGAAGPSTLSAERFAELTRDDVGKSELKLDFDSGEASREADEKAAEKRSAQAGDLAERVVDAFRKKAAQFARCSDANQERLKLQFTVTITGKVVNSKLDGTPSAAKRSCVLEILGRAIFPAGTEPLTYSNTLLL